MIFWKDKSKNTAEFRSVLIRMFTNFGGELVFSADLCYDGTNKKPPFAQGSLKIRTIEVRALPEAFVIRRRNRQ